MQVGEAARNFGVAALIVVVLEEPGPAAARDSGGSGLVVADLGALQRAPIAGKDLAASGVVGVSIKGQSPLVGSSQPQSSACPSIMNSARQLFDTQMPFRS